MRAASHRHLLPGFEISCQDIEVWLVGAFDSVSAVFVLQTIASSESLRHQIAGRVQSLFWAGEWCTELPALLRTYECDRCRLIVPLLSQPFDLSIVKLGPKPRHAFCAISQAPSISSLCG
jgi:hypothetical protein